MKTLPFETFSTTADVGIRIRGNDYLELFKNALNGLNQLFFSNQTIPNPQPGNISYYPFIYTANDCETLLVNFLSEISYLLQSENKLTSDFIAHEITDTSLNIELFTSPCPNHLQREMEIKAVTYHNLKVLDVQGVKSAQIIFDI